MTKFITIQDRRRNTHTLMVGTSPNLKKFHQRSMSAKFTFASIINHKSKQLKLISYDNNNKHKYIKLREFNSTIIIQNLR